MALFPRVMVVFSFLVFPIAWGTQNSMMETSHKINESPPINSRPAESPQIARPSTPKVSPNIQTTIPESHSVTLETKEKKVVEPAKVSPITTPTGDKDKLNNIPAEDKKTIPNSVPIKTSNDNENVIAQPKVSIAVSKNSPVPADTEVNIEKVTDPNIKKEDLPARRVLDGAINTESIPKAESALDIVIHDPKGNGEQKKDQGRKEEQSKHETLKNENMKDRKDVQARQDKKGRQDAQHKKNKENKGNNEKRDKEDKRTKEDKKDRKDKKDILVTPGEQPPVVTPPVTPDEQPPVVTPPVTGEQPPIVTPGVVPRPKVNDSTPNNTAQSSQSSILENPLTNGVANTEIFLDSIEINEQTRIDILSRHNPFDTLSSISSLNLATPNSINIFLLTSIPQKFCTKFDYDVRFDVRLNKTNYGKYRQFCYTPENSLTDFIRCKCANYHLKTFNRKLFTK